MEITSTDIAVLGQSYLEAMSGMSPSSAAFGVSRRASEHASLAMNQVPAKPASSRQSTASLEAIAEVSASAEQRSQVDALEQTDFRME